MLNDQPRHRDGKWKPKQTSQGSLPSSPSVSRSKARRSDPPQRRWPLFAARNLRKAAKEAGVEPGADAPETMRRIVHAEAEASTPGFGNAVKAIRSAGGVTDPLDKTQELIAAGHPAEAAVTAALVELHAPAAA